MIRSIELRNWKTHKDTRLGFQQGVNVLLGVMGAGKSSVIDAISFAFFGTFPALKQSRAKIEDIPTNRPTFEDKAEVEITFDIGDDIYVIKRIVKRGKSSEALIEKNGKYLQTQPERVNEEIASLLKIDYDTFSRAIYAEQNRLDYFLELRKGERKKAIDEMLGLDHFATVEENVTSLINNVKGLLKEDDRIIQNADVKALREQLAALTEELKKLNAEISEIDKEHAVLETKKLDNASKLSKMKKEYAERMELNDRATQVKSRITTLDEEFKLIESLGINPKISSEIDELSKKESDLNSSISELRRSQQKLTANTAELKERIKINEKKESDYRNMERDLKELNSQDIEKRVDENTLQIQDAMNMLAKNSTRADEIREWVRELQKHISKCPVCERELDENLRVQLLKGKEDLLKEIDERNVKIRAEIGIKNLEIKKLGALHDKLKLLRSKISEHSDLSVNIENDKKALESANAELSNITKKIDEKDTEHKALSKRLEQARTMLEKLEHMRKISLEMKHDNEKLAKINEMLKSMQIDQGSIDAVQKEFTDISTRFSALVSKLESNAKFRNSLSQQIDEKKRGLALVDEVDARIKSRAALIDNLSKFKTALIDTEVFLRTQLVTSINGLMQNLWQGLYPYSDYPALMLNAHKDDYVLEANLNIDGNDIWVPIDTVASGGERSVACLTLRIAMGMVIVPNLRWLILDEPTHNLDNAGIQRLIEVFSNTLPEIVEQIFIITHDDDLKQINSARVYTLERDKGVNGTTNAVEA